MMKFSICNEGFGDWPIDRVFRAAARLGYDGVEIAPYTLGESVTHIDAAHRKAIRTAARDAGVGIVGLHWLLVKPEGLHINHPDDAIRARTQDYLCELVRFCHDLGARVMTFGSPKQRNLLNGESYHDVWDRTKQVFAAVAEVAAAGGVTVCMEPLPANETNFINTVDEALAFACEVDHPNVKIVLDVKSMSTESQPIPLLVQKSAGMAGHVHANDVNRKGPGFGDTDFAPVAEALKAIGYDGYVSVEPFDFSPGAETMARKSLEYLKSVF